jgi:hypothetical protein
MAEFVRVIEQFAVILYAVCLAGVVWSIRSALAARRDRSDTLYALERETAAARFGRSLLSALAFVGLGAIVFFVAQFVAPALPAADAPTATPSGPLVTLTPTVTPFPTPTPQNSPTPEPLSNAPSASVQPVAPSTPEATAIPPAPASCPDPNVRISAPGDGAVLSGPFQVFGTVNIDNFSFYKFVLNGPATNFQDQTASDVYKSPVVNNYLGTLEEPLVAVLLQSPGAYRFRLVAVNNEGNEAPHCVITLQFRPPSPAPY